MATPATRRIRPRTRLNQITDFLAHRRLALIGVSRQATDISRALMRDLSKRGYEVVPVNPNLDQVDGRKCVARVQQIVPPVEAALLFTSTQVTDTVVRDCAAAGVKQLWIRAGVDRLAAATLAFCDEQGLEVIAGECPYMFLPGSGWFHQLHGFTRKVTGRYPR